MQRAALLPAADGDVAEVNALGTTPNKCVCGLQLIFYAGNTSFPLEIHKVFLQENVFFRTQNLWLNALADLLGIVPERNRFMHSMNCHAT